jgi:phenylacetate-coenzyme A ligase PaaK-like adenylate-forming protein
MIMERKDFPPVAERMLADLLSAPKEEAKLCGLRMTSGTSGGEPLLLAWGSGVNIHTFPSGAERTLLCQGALGTKLGSLLFLRNSDIGSPSRVIVMDARDMKNEISGLLADFAPDRLYGFTSFISRTIDFLDEKTKRGVKSLRFTGEGLPKQVAEIMNSSFPQAEIKMLYSSGETGQISKPSCGYIPLNYYHPHDGVTVEIDDPDETGVGDILISKNFGRNISIKRYRIGDSGRLHNIKCECGEKTAFEIVGKSGYDYIKLAGAILRREEFDRVAQMCNDLMDDYFVRADSVISEGKLKGKITLIIYRKSGQCDDSILEEIKRRFSEELFLTAEKTLNELVENGYIIPLVVEFGGAKREKKGKEIKLSQRI